MASSLQRQSDRNRHAWIGLLCDGAFSGCIASMASTAVLSACSQQENGDPYAPTNAISHWLWGEHAAHQDAPSMRYTATGYVIHHASSTLWASVYEKWMKSRRAKRQTGTAISRGLAVAALACFVDYHLTPPRLRPGFEKRLSRRSLFLVYGAFGLGLSMRGLIFSRRP